MVVEPVAGTREAAEDGPVPAAVTGSAADVLGGYLHGRAAEFLRALRAHARGAGGAGAPGGGTGGSGDGTGPDAAAGPERDGTAQAVDGLRAAARRLGGTLLTYRPLLDAAWADGLRTELSWLAGTLGREHAYAARLERLLGALHRLAGPSSSVQDPGGPDAGDRSAGPPVRAGDRAGAAARANSALPVGAARAGALLDRQLTLARTRAHSAALQALGSARFHAVADAVALLASEAPFRADEERIGLPAQAVLEPLAEQARRRLADAVAALPLSRAGAPYNAEGLARSLTTEARQDAAWDQVRVLLRLCRYAQEVLETRGEPDARTRSAGQALERHRQASAAAAAAASAAATPRIAPATAYALGVLHADQRHEVEAARFAFGHHWAPGLPTSPGPDAL
ncbi:CHAD domain-containing protein [Streptomyces tubbatahanensis]|uniref:CHAD domain-containing protein n=1 Tax=Streptomyces tubbatahanensis TaxID=2923272 RepID=A0ABY3XTF5_9ACTN|nr:CHAD domain-containing protein [Streptomyces tubbatahanensis]UNS97698.1 CHAD domain-containing protein [Streptomyces tubbatahanensis]